MKNEIKKIYIYDKNKRKHREKKKKKHLNSDYLQPLNNSRDFGYE